VTAKPPGITIVTSSSQIQVQEYQMKWKSANKNPFFLFGDALPFLGLVCFRY